MSFRNVSIKNKLLLSFLLVVLPLASFSMIALYYAFDSSIKKELKARGIFIASHLAHRTQVPLSFKYRLMLQKVVDEERLLSDDLAYIVILDSEGKPFAHTYKNGEFPAWVLQQNILKPDQNYRTELISAKEHPYKGYKGYIYDIAVPVNLDDRFLGTVRVGLRLDHTLLRIYKTVGLLAVMALLAVAVSVLISVVLSRQITRPLFWLTSVAENIARGKLDSISGLGKGPSCWEFMKCNKEDCPAYGKPMLIPCWYVEGTLCQGQRQGVYAQKIGDCKKCKFYKKHYKDTLNYLNEAFVYMDRSLASRDREIKKHVKKLEFINRLIRDISAKLDLNEVLSGVVRSAAEAVGADAGAIAIYDEQQQKITYPYFYNLPEDLARVVVPRGGGLAGCTMQERQPILLEDYPTHPNAVPEFVESGLKTLLAVPLISGEKVLGALGIFGFTPEKRFSPDDIPVIQAIGDEAAIAIDNARLYEALKKSAAELEERVAERTAELEVTHEKLLHAEKLSALGKLASSIAHEFNNPIYGIQMVLENLNEKAELDKTDKKSVSLAIKECNRISSMIRNLQDFYSPTTETIVPLDVHQLIEDTLHICQKELVAGGISVTKDFVKNVPKIPVGIDQIKQVFLNIITNAREAMTDSGGRLGIKTKISGDKLQVLFNNNGAVIPEENIGKLFDPFFTTKAGVKGIGLGLSVSYGIIKGYGGDILVESNPNEGTTFTVELPIKGSIELVLDQEENTSAKLEGCVASM
jgi:signal transduction histidine kinase